MYTRKTGLAALGFALTLLTTLSWPASAQNPAATHDFDGNGYSDFAWEDASGDVAIWLFTPGLGTVGSNSIGTMSPGAGWNLVGEDKFFGGSTSQLLWQNVQNNQLVIWTVIGIGGFAENTFDIGTGNPGWLVEGTGDFDGNGSADILWRNVDTGEVGIWLMSNGTVVSKATLNGDTSWTIKGVGDFNGDGMADILWQNVNTNALSIWFMNGTQIISNAGFGPANPGWNIVGTGDFNGDGMADILWESNDYQVGIWLMDGATPTAQVVVPGQPVDWKIINTGDYNGDGKSDIAFQNLDSYAVTIWCVSGTQTIPCGGNLTHQPPPGPWFLQGPGKMAPFPFP
jgi:FG-GAP-like repeat